MALSEFGEYVGDAVDEWGRRRLSGLLEDGARLLAASGGATLLMVADAVGLSDAAFRNKALSIADAVGLTDSSYGNKPCLLNDSASLADHANVLKLLKMSDTITLVDNTLTSARLMLLLDALVSMDNVAVNKVLQIKENASLLEIVESGVGGLKKTRLFLVIGNLAVQLSGE